MTFSQTKFLPSSLQARLAVYLKTLYIDLSLKEPILPAWVQPVAPGALCPARLEPELRLSSLSHGLNECISVDQILTAIHVSLTHLINTISKQACHLSTEEEFLCLNLLKVKCDKKLH